MTATAMTSPLGEKHRFSEVWLITIGHSLTHWYPATFYVLAPLIGNELGLTYTQIASIVTAQAIAGALTNVPGGIISDVVRRKGLMMALSLAWVGLPYMLMAMTSAYWMLLACAILIGVGNTIWHPTAIPTLGRRFPERRALVVSVHGMGGNVGDALAPFVAGVLVSGFAIGTLIDLPALSWRQVMIYNVVPGIVMAVAILWQLGRMRLDAKDQGAEKDLSLIEVARGFGGLLRNSTMMMLATSSAFRSMTQGSLMVFVPLYLANTMGYSAWAVGTAMMSLQLCGFVAAPIAGTMADRMGYRRIIMSSMAMTAVVLIFMVAAGGTPAFVFFVALLGFFLFAVRAVLQAWTLEATPKNMGGSAIGLLFGIQAVGGAIGPLASGLLADRYGLIAAFYFMATTIVIANMFVFFIPKPQRTTADAPAE